MLDVNLYPEALVFGLAITGNSCQDIRETFVQSCWSVSRGTFTSCHPRTQCKPQRAALTQRSACPLRADKNQTPSKHLEQVILVGRRNGLSPVLISEYLFVRYFSTHSSDLHALKGHIAAGNSVPWTFSDLRARPPRRVGGQASADNRWTYEQPEMLSSCICCPTTRHVRESMSFILVLHPPLMLPFVSVVWNEEITSYHLNVLLWGYKSTVSFHDFHKFHPKAKYPTSCG